MGNYHEVRFGGDKKRKILWDELTSFIEHKYLFNVRSILEVGAGYCDFINKIKIKKKYALDNWEGIKKYANKDINIIFDDVNNIKNISIKIDSIFASNILEHLKKNEVLIFLNNAFDKLNKNGKLIILQPNYRHSFKNYFDDYTHQSIWTDTSIVDAAISSGFTLVKKIPKFLPLTLKSKFPVNKYLIRLYLNQPFKIFSGQMLIVLQK